MTPALTGQRVLVTRPAERAGGFIARLEAEGARPVAFPTLAIEALPAPAVARANPDCIIFVSPAAVAHGAGLITAEAMLGAVGPATRAALQAHGHEATLEPVGSHDSEGLLRHPALAREHVAGREVLLVRGTGGREHLSEALVARGATVHYAEVYRRVRPTGADPDAAAASDITTITSNEGMTNLLALLTPTGRSRILRRPLAVPGERAAARARELGFSGPVAVAGGADDAAMLAAVTRCAEATSNGTTGPA